MHLRKAGPFQGYDALAFMRERPSAVDRALLTCELTCKGHTLLSAPALLCMVRF